MKKIESEYKNASWIKEKYIKDRMTIKELAIIANVSDRTMLNWMIDFGIERRTQSESIKGRYTGEKSSFYGKHHSEETRAKISKNHANVSGENNPMFGKTGILSPNFGKQVSKKHEINYQNLILVVKDQKLLGLKTLHGRVVKHH